MNNTLRTVLSIVFALFVAFVFIHFLLWIFKVALELVFGTMFVIAVVIIALPFYMLFKKKMFR